MGLDEYFYSIYSNGHNASHKTEKDRLNFLKCLENPKVSDAIQNYFSKKKLLRLPKEYCVVPQIAKEVWDDLGHYSIDWEVSIDDALRFTDPTNILEIKKRSNLELQYSSGIFLCEDNKEFHVIHSNKLSSDYSTLVDPQISKVLKFQNKIRISKIGLENVLG